jgi:hypothetical protein
MSIILPSLAIAFAAFCVWLGVRAYNRRERWAKWTAVGLTVLLAYPLSFGPVCWLSERTKEGTDAISTIYQPLLRLWYENKQLGSVLRWYAMLGAKGNEVTTTRSRADGQMTIGWYGMQN